jgi:hypothetical protein
MRAKGRGWGMGVRVGVRRVYGMAPHVGASGRSSKAHGGCSLQASGRSNEAHGGRSEAHGG